MATVVKRQSARANVTRLRSSEEWYRYFSQNERELLPIPWEKGSGIASAEVAAIASSIQGFQLGESSEGFHLSKCAKEYSQRATDPYYFEAAKLFIKEEQRHARDLGRFMGLAGIPVVRRTWPDTVFRKLRHMADLEISVSVLLTAEIIAKVYYPVLREATGSMVLRALCEQIIHDEGPHVEFQAQRLAILRKNRPAVSLLLTHVLHRVLFGGTCLVVWYKHRKAIGAGGLAFRGFWRRCWREFAVTQRLMNPRTYEQCSRFPRS